MDNSFDADNHIMQEAAQISHREDLSPGPHSRADADSPDLVIDGNTADFSRWAMGDREAACDLSAVRDVLDTTAPAEPVSSGPLLLTEGPHLGVMIQCICHKLCNHLSYLRLPLWVRHVLSSLP